MFSATTPTPHLCPWVSPSPQSVGTLRQEASAAVRHGDYGTAIDVLTQVLQQQPHSAMDYNNRGFVYLKLGQEAAALADLNQALALDPSLDSAYNNRGNYYAQQGRLTQALNDYHQALSHNPHNDRARLNLGITLRDMGLHRLALENFNALIAFDKLPAHAYAERGRTHYLAGHWNWAMGDYHTALAALGDPTLGNLGGLHHRLMTWIAEFGLESAEVVHFPRFPEFPQFA
ncbi:tetratricopeptide repeat protein [Prochlorothrix hollandica]|uniref:tetratricopeptide repeat protein n=1 Tax=Prochlorothrix hollandica TaxID=1223 RepID=UPI0003452326|nr:tetratricopeptide repeat protein [Prochlorothrix hollandica]